MGVTVRVGLQADPTTGIFDEVNNKYGCDFSYFNFYALWEELGLEASSEYGTIGKTDLRKFTRKCLDYHGSYAQHVIFLLRLCHYGKLQGADEITWA